MDPFRFEISLRTRILGVVAASAPLVACGSDNQCQSMCGCNPPPPQTYSVTYTPCPPIDVDAATVDASDNDAGDGAADAEVEAAPPPMCFYSCQQACEAQKPYSTTGGVAQCTSSPTADSGPVTVQCEILQLCGRRFDGLVEAMRGDGSALGEALARAAWLEAASIHAFRRLARELRAHGAPRELVDAARACAKDEARHARAMARLARRHGAVVPRVEAGEHGVRDLEAIARENAVEACVGETHGALLAEWAATYATDAGVREAMRAIAPDELRHAALGWSIAAWADSRLSDEARARVNEARQEAARDIMQHASIEPNGDVAAAMGVPRAREATRLAATMWS